MDWETVIARLESAFKFLQSPEACERERLVGAAVYEVLDALKSGLESAQEAQSRAEDQPDP